MDERRMPGTPFMAMGEVSMTQASYDIVIPGSVRQDERLSPIEMLLYGEVRGLCKLNGFCWASSTFLARRMQADSRSIRRWLKKLEDCNHISIKHGEETDLPGATENTRKITLTEGRTDQSAGRTGESYHRTPRSACRTSQSAKGRTPESAKASGIRKNTLKTTTTNKKAVGVVNEISEKIKNRFGSAKVLREFYAHCGGDVGLMQRYLDYADREKAKNPPGLAASLASQRGTDGPPGGAAEKSCALCEKPAVKCVRIGGREIGLCEIHRREYAERKNAGDQGHLKMLGSAAAG